MSDKAWIEQDKDFAEGLINDINGTQGLDFFIDCANRPGVTGFRWVCAGEMSEYFPSSKEALIDFIRVAAQRMRT